MSRNQIPSAQASETGDREIDTEIDRRPWALQAEHSVHYGWQFSLSPSRTTYQNIPISSHIIGCACTRTALGPIFDKKTYDITLVSGFLESCVVPQLKATDNLVGLFWGPPSLI